MLMRSHTIVPERVSIVPVYRLHLLSGTSLIVASEPFPPPLLTKLLAPFQRFSGSNLLSVTKPLKHLMQHPLHVASQRYGPLHVASRTACRFQTASCRFCTAS
eukprot:2592537-Prymnesium_polylepis.1